jgi:hypothetical protein
MSTCISRVGSASVRARARKHVERLAELMNGECLPTPDLAGCAEPCGRRSTVHSTWTTSCWILFQRVPRRIGASVPAIVGIKPLIVRSTTRLPSVLVNAAACHKGLCAHVSVSTRRPEQTSCSGQARERHDSERACDMPAGDHVRRAQEPGSVAAMSRVMLGLRAPPSYGPTRGVDRRI